MRNLKLVLINLIIFLIIMLAILFYIINQRDKNEENNINIQNVQIETDSTINEGDFKQSEIYNEVTSPTTYYTVNGYIEDFFNTVKTLNTNNSNTNKLLNILDNNYIASNSIDNSNLNDKIIKYANSSYNINNIYEYFYSDRLRTYCASVTFNPQIDGITNYNIYFCLDYDTGAYKIYPAGNNTSYINTKNIELNEYNSFKNTSVNDLTMCNNYLNLYIESVKNNVNESYNLLNEEYKNKRFSNLQNYIQYINENKDIIINSKVSEYKTNVRSDGSKQYIIIDNYNKYYIIEAKSVMNYSIMLDSYTIPTSETENKYNSSTEIQKACMCLELVKEMINNNDYQSIYNHLNETFKNNNFASLEQFSNFINNKYYSLNNFDFESYSVSNGNYIVNVKVSDSSDENKSFNMTFIVKLEESIADFEISFNI